MPEVRTPQLWVGLLLLAVCWPLNWLLPGVRTTYLFFPLWLGYILVVDALVDRRTGASFLRRNPRGFVGLFFLSAPAWWLFEVINWRTRNWEYLGVEHFSDLEYFLLATICFSTVMPAVFETAELVRTFRWIELFARGPRVPDTPRTQALFATAGLVMFALVMAWPRYAYPMVWTSLVFMLEPINARLGRRHLAEDWARGDWRTAVALSVGALICGFFWEMWNFYSYPKWIYHTPGAQFWHVFEMPLLGYGGYLFFAWELFSLCNLFWPQRDALKV